MFTGSIWRYWEYLTHKKKLTPPKGDAAYKAKGIKKQSWFQAQNLVDTEHYKKKVAEW